MRTNKSLALCQQPNKFLALLPRVVTFFGVWIDILAKVKFDNLRKKEQIFFFFFLCLRIFHISFPIFTCFLFVASLLFFFFFFFCIFMEGAEYNVQRRDK